MNSFARDELRTKSHGQEVISAVEEVEMQVHMQPSCSEVICLISQSPSAPSSPASAHSMLAIALIITILLQIKTVCRKWKKNLFCHTDTSSKVFNNLISKTRQVTTYQVIILSGAYRSNIWVCVPVCPLCLSRPCSVLTPSECVFSFYFTRKNHGRYMAQEY